MQGKWIAKAAVQKGLSFLPDPQRWNRVLQDRVTGGTTMKAEFLDKHVSWAGQHLDIAERCGVPLQGFTALELGSGWFPVVPICFHLAGADRVYLCDLEDLSDLGMLAQSIDGVLSSLDDENLVAATSRFDPARVESLRQLRSELDGLGLAGARARLGLEPAFGDARQVSPSPAPELICSNTVLEHIAPEVLVGILARLAEVAAPGAVMAHLVDLCDHYAYVDDNIGVYHFLRYPERWWRWIDNDIQPMNRLRAHEYADLFDRAGVELTEEHRLDFDVDDLFGVPLAEKFANMTPDQVACKTIWLVSRL